MQPDFPADHHKGELLGSASIRKFCQRRTPGGLLPRVKLLPPIAKVVIPFLDHPIRRPLMGRYFVDIGQACFHVFGREILCKASGGQLKKVSLTACSIAQAECRPIVRLRNADDILAQLAIDIKVFSRPGSNGCLEDQSRPEG
jgi:hypothetical protein